MNRSHTSKAQAVLDVTKVSLPSGETVGGPIVSMAWDPTGRYLALACEESSLVTVFCTEILPLRLQVTPCCFVNGIGDEVPSTICFQKNFAEGACLTIAWSSGRVQHFPIVYTDTY